MLAACGNSNAPANGSAGSGATGSSGSSPAQAPTPAPAPPCLVGTWDGKDIVDKIRGATRSLSKAGLTRTTGTITFEFRAPTDNKGDVIVHADKLVLKLALGESGLKVSGTTTIDGTQTMPYTLGDNDALTLAPPSEGKIPVRTVVKTTGLVSTQNTETGALDLHDDLLYTCEGNSLQLWKRSKTGEKRGKPMLVLERK